MVDVTSGDMTLLFEALDTVFDEAKMTNEFGSDSAMSGGRDMVAGTTEVGGRERYAWRAKRGPTRRDSVEDQSGFGEGCRRRRKVEAVGKVETNLRTLWCRCSR